MEETYYLRSDKKRPRRQRSKVHQPVTSKPGEKQQDAVMEQLRQQYGSDKIEMADENGRTRSVNLSDFSFN